MIDYLAKKKSKNLVSWNGEIWLCFTLAWKVKIILQILFQKNSQKLHAQTTRFEVSNIYLRNNVKVRRKTLMTSTFLFIFNKIGR